MGMTIDEAIPILHDMYNYYNDVDVDAYVGFDNEDNNAIETALETMRTYQQLQADYKNRLKADMVAMLTEIQLELEEEKQDTKHFHYDDLENAESYNDGIDDCIDTIQQKINALKEK